MTLQFSKSEPFTIGTEVEFQLLAPLTFDLTPKAPDILKKITKENKESFKPEFIKSMIEVISKPFQRIEQLEENLNSLCLQLENICSQENCLPYSASLHPFATLEQRKVSDNERYHSIMADLQIVGRRLITQGLHVHIGMPDKHTAIKVNDGFLIYLPLLLALSCSSPFYLNENTGFKSYRSKLFESLPRSGIPAPHGNWQNFNDLIDTFSNNRIISGIREIWWDIRPHTEFGTVEIRICDLPSRFKEIIAIIALIQALAVHIARSALPDYDSSTIHLIQYNKWQAARYGISGQFFDFKTQKIISIKKAVHHLLEDLQTTAAELQTLGYFSIIEDIINIGTSADLQLNLFKQSGDHGNVIKKIIGEFWN